MKKFLINFIIGLCLIGVGTGISLSEFTNFQVIKYTDNNENIEEILFNIPQNTNFIDMSKNIYYYNNKINVEIIIDDSIDQNKIKFLYDNNSNFSNIYISNSLTTNENTDTNEQFSSIYIHINAISTFDFFIYQIKNLKYNKYIEYPEIEIKAFVNSETFKKII